MTAPVIVYQRPDPATRTPDNSCQWIGEATVDDRSYTAISRLCPANDIARQLLAEGVSDRPLEVHTEGIAGALVWPSFHKAAERHFVESASTPVQSISWARVAADRARAEQISQRRKQAKAGCVQAPKRGATDGPAMSGHPGPDAPVNGLVDEAAE